VNILFQIHFMKKTTAGTEKREYTLDAAGQKLGRLATQISNILLGKNEPDFQKNTMANVNVTVNNASKLDLSSARMNDEYKRYSGYPGGLKFETREHFLKKHGFAELIRKTVRNMLPANRLRKDTLKNITVND